jgi:hypothetical protein
MMNRRFYPIIRPTLIGVGVVFALQSGTIAQVKPPEAFFKASRDCAAKPAIKGDNPGNITLTIDQVYPAIGLNRNNGSAVLLRIATAEPDRRWVAIDCGSFQATIGASGVPSVPTPNPTVPSPNPSPTPTANSACAVGPVPKTFFDDTCTLVPVGNQAAPADISPPKPTLNTFDRRIVELCGTDFGGAVSPARFGQLMRDYPDVRQRLQNDVGGALNPGQTTPAQFITDLTTIWFKAKGFQHVFCGEKDGSPDNEMGIGGLHFTGRYLDLQERGLAEMIAKTSNNADATEEVVPGVIYTFGAKVKLPNGQTLNHKIKGYPYTMNAQEILLAATKTYKTSTAQACLVTVQDTTVAPFPVQAVTFKAKFVRKNGGIRTFYPMAKPTGEDC